MQSFLFHLPRGTRGQSSLRELLQPLVEGVLNDKNLSINTNPLEVYKAWINQMESETGEARYKCSSEVFIYGVKQKLLFTLLGTFVDLLFIIASF